MGNTDASFDRDSADDVGSSRPSLAYCSPDLNGGVNVRPVMFLVTDWLCAFLTLAFAIAFIDACQLNLMEAPMNGGGSSYINSAPCNEQWQKDHPEFTAFILSLPHELFDLVAVVMLLLYFFTGLTLPYLILGWLAYRTWSQRNSVRRMALLALPLLLMLAMSPWLHKCMMVIAD